MTVRQRVVVVTGGGGGIGAAIAESVSRTGAFVVTVDPLVSVDGSTALAQPEQTTADRIVAAGGGARSSTVSVTDESGLTQLFTELADEFGGLDAVVNVAGISRPTGFAKGSEQDWLDVLSVHLDGYRNVLGAALPLMAAAGRGHIVGVTSGSGWRAADAGAYGCAKRAVASLTWQLGRNAPKGVVINAISPIAATRMVAAALARTQQDGRVSTGGLSLQTMPQADELGPLGAHLVSDAFAACQGRVLFLGGSEVAVIDEPRLIEVVPSGGTSASRQIIEAATTIALVPAEANQVSGGGSNARFGSAFSQAPATTVTPSQTTSTCAVVADRPAVAAAISAALDARGTTPVQIDCCTALTDIGALDAVVVALAGRSAPVGAPSGWKKILDEHAEVVADIYADGQWSRAVADLSISTGRPVRLVTVTDATTAGGRSRAQACAQLARSGHEATGNLVTPFAVSAESSDIPAELVAHLVCSPEAAGLAGAELVSGAGWFGLRSHPRPIGSISFGGPEVPPWFDETLREVVQTR
ncbi:NAD(P)-dependent dehydrogenase (short-subunit alcohol dehydrogenase family) [Mycobacterium sp. BK086]|uniref:SDR family NAD(P)-dependent oxidoreductase n=1 Tax=Mycobacterium sp. BK086 TaxID=2512165 RepID=UPI00105D1B07|nr:SDR family oxidoreductase [Mycobacterium sp. BK086]TDO06992.1 NAD(P)-dependent dehydrogenase (short-subunit alcohol dehydrogenase family) [Mycobacterium sp. BK086]